MTDQRWSRIQDLFTRAADLPPENQPTAIAEWTDDPVLIAEVLKLLQADAAEHPLIDRGVEEAAAGLLEFAPLTAHIRTQIGPYRVLEMIGEGGTGVVYRAERTDIGSQVAIKLLRDAWFSASRRERFSAEQRMLGQLNHPGIARIYDSGSLEDGTPWFVMEYVPGTTLTGYWSEHCGSLRDCLRLFRRVCDAVQYAHEHAIIHRDLKPSNILVTADGEVKLLDFGIAKQLAAESGDNQKTAAELAMMTPEYCAPEQLTGEPLGVYTDIYALGVLLFELLAGRLPFAGEGNDPAALLRRTLEEAPARPSSLARQGIAVSRSEWSDLDAICLRALRRQPTERYRSVDAMVRDIDAFLEGRTLEARPDSLAYTVGKFVRRHRLALGTAAAILLVATAAGVFYTVRLARARNNALAEAARTQRIQQFMLNLFGDEDAEAAPSKDLKVVTLLDRGVKEISSLNEDVATQAELYETLGSMYSRMAKYDQASEMLIHSLTAMRQATGDTSAKVAGVLLDLAVVRGDQGKLEEGMRYVEQASSLVKLNHLPPTDPLALKASMVAGRLSSQSGAYQKAVAILTPIAELKPPYTERQAYNVRDSLTVLTGAELALHQLALARAACLRAIDMDRRLFGVSHPRTTEDLLNLAAIDTTSRQLPEAEKAYREGIAGMSGWYGPDDPDVVTARSLLAMVLTAEKKNAEAEAILKQALPLLEKTYGPVHERVAHTLNTLGDLAFARGDMRAAEADYSRAYTIARSLFGEKNAYTAMYCSNLAKTYLAESKDAMAESLQRRAVEFLATLPPGNAVIGTARGRWGRALLALGKYAEAEEQLTTAYRLLKSQPHASVSDLRGVSEDLIKLYKKTGQVDKEEAAKAELAAQP